jgi:predicted acetyltransferase
VVAAALPAMRERGEAISPLGPATTRLYRGLGWELAGAQCWRNVQTRTLELLPGPAGVSIRAAIEDDLPAIRACYERVAAETDGFLDRRDLYWAMWSASWWDPGHYTYVVDADDGDIAGYLAYHHIPSTGNPGFGIVVDDIVAAEPDAAVALWRLLGSSSAQVDKVSYASSPEDDLLLMLPEQDRKMLYEFRWMLRMVDVDRAVAARGFPAGLHVAVDLDVADRHCDWNTGRRRVVVEDGHGRVEHGGAGDVRVSIGALAALYSGYASARRLRRLGHMSGPDKSIAALDAAFAGPTPWMPDDF